MALLNAAEMPELYLSVRIEYLPSDSITAS